MLIHGARLITGAGDGVVRESPRGWVHIVDGVVREVGEGDAPRAAPSTPTWWMRRPSSVAGRS